MCKGSCFLLEKVIIIVKTTKPNLTTFPWPHLINVRNRVTLVLKTNKTSFFYCILTHCYCTSTSLLRHLCMYGRKKELYNLVSLKWKRTKLLKQVQKAIKNLLKGPCDFFMLCQHWQTLNLKKKKKRGRMKRADGLFLWWNIREFNVRFLIAVSKDLYCKSLVLAVARFSKTFVTITTFGKPRRWFPGQWIAIKC